jgi:hypothetical protein
MSAGTHKQSFRINEELDLDNSLFADYSFSWSPNACFINDPAPATRKQRLSKNYVSVQNNPIATPVTHGSLRKVRSILKVSSRKVSSAEEVAEPGNALEDDLGLQRHAQPTSKSVSQHRSRQSLDQRSNFTDKPSRSSMVSKRLSISSLFSESDREMKRKRNKLRKKSRQSLCLPQAVSYEALDLPPGVTQSGRGIGYTYRSPTSQSRLSLNQLNAKNFLSILGGFLSGKNTSAENLPNSRNDVMQHIYGSNWSVAHTAEAMMSTTNFGIPDGLGRRVDSMDGGRDFMTTAMSAKRSMDTQIASAGYN